MRSPIKRGVPRLRGWCDSRRRAAFADRSASQKTRGASHAAVQDPQQAKSGHQNPSRTALPPRTTRLPRAWCVPQYVLLEMGTFARDLLADGGAQAPRLARETRLRREVARVNDVYPR